MASVAKVWQKPRRKSFRHINFIADEFGQREEDMPRDVIRSKGDGSWGIKEVNGKKYLRFVKHIGVNDRKRVEVVGQTEKECLKKDA